MTDTDPSLIALTETIPGGAYWSGIIKRGNTLRIIDRTGSAGVALLCYNADNPIERLNVADTAKIQFNAFLTKNYVIYSDMGRVLFSITEDTSGCHDLLTGCSNKASNQRKYGEGGWANSRDNFGKALTRWGLGRADIMPNLNLFTRIAVEPDGQIKFGENCVKPGSFMDLRAEMNVLAVISNCPHPLHPDASYAPQPIELQIWRSPAPLPDDICRNANPEAVRGFINTDALFSQ
jgi:uncharacterized protein